MNNAICKEDHRYLEALRDLPDSQSPDEGRHRCAGCAYEKGIEDGKAGNVKTINVENLPLSQAGTGRHKSCTAAYELGYEVGINQR